MHQGILRSDVRRAGTVVTASRYD